MKPKEYEIDSFEKLINVVNLQNIGAISKDLTLWLIYAIETYEKVRQQFPDQKEKTNWEIAKCHFIWVDDGKNDILETKIVNSQTGEVSTIKME